MLRELRADIGDSMAPGSDTDLGMLLKLSGAVLMVDGESGTTLCMVALVAHFRIGSGRLDGSSSFTRRSIIFAHVDHLPE